MKEKKRLSALIGTGLITGLLLGLLLCITSICMTNIVAQNYYELLRREGTDFLEESLSGINFDEEETGSSDPEADLPGHMEYYILRTIKDFNEKTFHEYERPRDAMALTNPEPVDIERAILFSDKEGKVLFESGDYVFFSYVTEEKWVKNQESTEGYGYIDLSETEVPFFYNVYEENKAYKERQLIKLSFSEDMVYDKIILKKLKITGTMDGNKITPVKIDYVTEEMLNDSGIPDHKINEYDTSGTMVWKNAFDQSLSTSKDSLVTIYASNPEVSIFDDKELLDILKKEGLSFANENSLDSVICSSVKNVGMEPDMTVLAAFSANPFKTAMNELRYVYVWSIIIYVLVWFVINFVIYKKYTGTVKAVTQGMNQNFDYIWKKEMDKGLWKEAYDLLNQYLDVRNRLFKDKSEIDRLKTALDYSATAEESRRQMVSNIAHELKTPLAIIHSYSEGLKENIAEEKKDEYYDVILSEIHRMDEMVMEMLDLSRLEAGKTKLSTDEFSLKQMTEAVFEKFSKTIDEKQLKVTFLAAHDYAVCADEARIYQVITNFISNAVLYTPKEGFIQVRIHQMFDEITFSIENTSQPFTKEELEKVWDTFYRIDKSRNSKGTGLGLAIARNIIELHGGSCSVKNTENGVEFQFTLTGRSI